MDNLEGSHRSDEPTTPITRISNHPKHNHVIHCVMGFKNPIDFTALKDELSNSVIIKIPLFSSLLVVDPQNGTEHWEKIHVNLDDHIVIHQDDDDHSYGHDDHPPISDDDAINSYLADMAISSPMSLDKPLWELHIMHEHKCAILRVHHAVADGMALMSLLWTMGSSSIKRVHDDGSKHHHHVMGMSNKKDIAFKGRSLTKMGLWEGLMYIWISLVFVLKFIGRCLWVKDKGAVISGIEGVEFWPRKVTIAKFLISDMKTIKNAIPNATINDVLYGILWCGLTRYLNIRHPAAFTARAKAVMDRKKRSMEARLCYDVGNLVFELFGSKVGGDLYYNLFSNTSFLMSNIAGPQEEISIAGNPITFIRATASAQPHAITLHMVS